jgi:hypothetical protein
MYQAVCLKTNKRYIGNTQQHVKTFMQGHIQDVKNLLISDKSSDSRLTLCFPNSGRNRQEKCQGFRQDQGRYPLAGRPTLLSTNFWYQNLQTVSEGMVRYHQAHPHDSQLGYQQVQQGPWRLPPQAEIPQV